jgi:anti-sigma factor RsiW
VKFDRKKLLGFVETFGKANVVAMNCEEFAAIGLDPEQQGEFARAQQAAAREHSIACPSCAALAESWEAARVELRLLASSTSLAETPPRVEMRLRQEFRTRHQTLKTRRAAVVASWALAAAVLLAAGISWSTWRAQHYAKPAAAAGNLDSGVNHSSVAKSGAENSVAPVADEDATLVANNEEDGFTALPGAISADNEDASIVRVRMQRSSLGAFGLAVNEERAADWIQVDLLVGDDGLPQAVRVPEAQ